MTEDVELRCCDECGAVIVEGEVHDCPYDEGYMVWPDDDPSQR